MWITPGSLLATALWVIIPLGFKVYLATFGTYNETYGAIGGVMVLLLWFYLSGIAILIGAELNAEIEHASPYGKDVGEKVPGERKRVGAAAHRDYDARRARAEMPVQPFADDVNCDLDRPAPKPMRSMKPSDVLIGAAELLPVAVKLGRDVKKKVRNGSGDAKSSTTRPERAYFFRSCGLSSGCQASGRNLPPHPQ